MADVTGEVGLLVRDGLERGIVEDEKRQRARQGVRAREEAARVVRRAEESVNLRGRRQRCGGRLRSEDQNLIAFR
jgi:hypothetical protein